MLGSMIDSVKLVIYYAWVQEKELIPKATTGGLNDRLSM